MKPTGNLSSIVSPGPSRIPVNVLKNYVDSFKNCSSQQGFFPDC